MGVFAEKHFDVDNEGSLLFRVEHDCLCGGNAHDVMGRSVLDRNPHSRWKVEVDGRQLTKQALI